MSVSPQEPEVITYVVFSIKDYVKLAMTTNRPSTKAISEKRASQLSVILIQDHIIDVDEALIVIINTNEASDDYVYPITSFHKSNPVAGWNHTEINDYICEMLNKFSEDDSVYMVKVCGTGDRNAFIGICTCASAEQKMAIVDIARVPILMA
jgi:hypothetical protein